MSVDVRPTPTADPEEYLQYRALSSAAVASLLLGLLSSLALLDWIWACVPLVGIVASVYAWKTVARRRDELTGLGLARLGLVLSIFFLVTGLGRLSHEYATEVPEGYDRLSYADLQPNPDLPGEVIPKSALSLEGKRVFIKGYIFPTEETKQFLLVRDQGECCFGGNPKLTDRIQVTLVDPLRLVAFKPRLYKVAGTFHVSFQPGQATGVAGGVYYQLEADYFK